MGSGAVIYIARLVQAFSKVNRAIHRQHGDVISLLIFFRKRKVGEKETKDINISGCLGLNMVLRHTITSISSLSYYV
jgi:hypothetical protein